MLALCSIISKNVSSMTDTRPLREIKLLLLGFAWKVQLQLTVSKFAKYNTYSNKYLHLLCITETYYNYCIRNNRTYSYCKTLLKYFGKTVSCICR